jgi:hypothetical protein
MLGAQVLASSNWTHPHDMGHLLEQQSIFSPDLSKAVFHQSILLCFRLEVCSRSGTFVINAAFHVT